MTLPEFGAFMDGFARFHGADDGDAPSIDEFKRALAEEAIAKARGALVE